MQSSGPTERKTGHREKERDRKDRYRYRSEKQATERCMSTEKGVREIKRTHRKWNKERKDIKYDSVRKTAYCEFSVNCLHNMF